MLKRVFYRYVFKLVLTVFLRVFDFIHLVIQLIIIIGYLMYVFVIRGRKGVEDLAQREFAEHLKSPSNGNPRT